MVLQYTLYDIRQNSRKHREKAVQMQPYLWLSQGHLKAFPHKKKWEKDGLLIR